MNVQERYTPIPMAANASRDLESLGLGGFICVTTGTLSVTRKDGATTTPLLTAFPVTAGVVYGLPIYLHTRGATVTLAGGASGTLLA